MHLVMGSRSAHWAFFRNESYSAAFRGHEGLIISPRIRPLPLDRVRWRHGLSLGLELGVDTASHGEGGWLKVVKVAG
jgi:hypothetical protein